MVCCFKHQHTVCVYVHVCMRVCQKGEYSGMQNCSCMAQSWHTCQVRGVVALSKVATSGCFNQVYLPPSTCMVRTSSALTRCITSICTHLISKTKVQILFFKELESLMEAYTCYIYIILASHVPHTQVIWHARHSW